MPNPLPVGSQTPASFERCQQICERFEAAWQETLRGAEPPSIDAFLQGTEAAERATLGAALEEIERQFRLKQAAARSAAYSETIGVTEMAPEHRDGHAEGSATEEIAADSNRDPQDTDFELNQAASVGFGATMDFAPKDEDAAGGGPMSGDTVEATPSGPAKPRKKKSAYPSVQGYEIVGELGRGGMGVVYKARQRGLKRLVALKMVLAGAHAGPEQLARFHTEAEAVARLQHHNIVQIYEVGEQDGLPFFSLEFVDGGSMAQLIAGKPMPVKRAAQLLAMLAHGMHYAHQNGIVHRDLKPANVLLTVDGLPKITDFGLAKRLEEGAGSQTQSGSLMGTPGYMAPEQARGDVKQIGPLADVYALGAILYETLTGRPPFAAATLLETLEQVRSQEPVPPSRLVPKTPKDLETICLKCLQKEPQKRYSSAGTLAEDLDRYLAGEPIRARPVGSVERLWRWCKRNPRIAGLAATILFLLVAGVIGSSYAAITIARERNQKEQERQAADAARILAEQRKEEADNERNQKEQERQAAVNARALAEQRKEEADAAHVQAQKNADVALEQSKLALRGFRTLIDEVQKQIGDSPGLQSLKGKLLETALEGLDKVAKSDEDSRLLGQTMAGAYMKMGQLFQQLGQSEKAFAQFQKCHDIIEALAARDPEGDVAQANLAATFTVLGEMAAELRRDMKASLDYYQKALTIRQGLNNRTLSDKLDPIKIKNEYAEAYTRVGVTFLKLGEPERALGYFQESLRLRQALSDAVPGDPGARLDLARSYNALGEVRFRARGFAAARDEFEKGLAAGERVQRDNPENPRFKWELANTLGNFGMFDLRCGNRDEARKHLSRCLALMEELADLDPKNAMYQRYLGLANYRYGTLVRRFNEPGGPERYNRKCLEIREKLAAADAKSERRRMELTLVLPRCGEHARAAEAAAKFRQSGAADREVLVEVAQCYAQSAAAVTDNPTLRTDYVAKALEALTEALAQGFKDAVILETEPDLDALRDQPGFQALVARLKKQESGNRNRESGTGS